jgi:hypothetical protein
MNKNKKKTEQKCRFCHVREFDDAKATQAREDFPAEDSIPLWPFALSQGKL